MDRKDTSREPVEPAPQAPRSPRKRFHLERLEERIAPAGHYNPQSKWVGGGGQGGSSNTISNQSSY